MNERDAREICRWKYSGRLAIYNYPDWDECRRQGWDITDPVRRLYSHFVISCHKKLFAYFILRDKGSFISLGLGMKPDLCGKHLGHILIELAVRTYINKYSMKKPLCLTVLTWNQRAIACYRAAGFVIEDEYYDTHAYIPGHRYRMKWSPKTR
ncbi:MAG: GNAT family N-acetyltransferase [Eubacteriales bacterium]|jgi:ribosomal-protein-alanine N-acetyltransferase